ncbi:chemotaxis protein CheB [Capillimicrobium parvum]|uniref:protein-glutamate methylesterase n=1 Tax=Capillimicrobium parvum TaxID=2884022 RepID=A0A9E7C1N3_9ACTN|nr:chemotaxis protein CheB [Capillimicrobium parvum]UGS36613.1 Protein-glutamate methylesterase/protein-glutamine glutaminase [Capillimicrobium parvum]
MAVGASAGGVEALADLVRALPEDLAVPIVVVMHLPASGTSVLPAILDRASPLPALPIADGEALAPGRIYVGPPDHHVIVGRGELSLTHGPRENGYRPAVDVLFRTAALSYGPAAIGIVLSGTLDDGAAGLGVIKAHGGIAIVQSPDDATYAGMPQAAIDRVDVDHVCPVREIAALLPLLAAGDPLPAIGPALLPDPLLDVPTSEEHASGFICPDCGGALWTVDEGGVARYRCRIGHAFSEHSLLTVQGADVEAALWAALRSLEERAALLRRIAGRAEEAGNRKSAASFRAKAADADRQAEVIRAGVLPAPLDVGAAGGNVTS